MAIVVRWELRRFGYPHEVEGITADITETRSAQVEGYQTKWTTSGFFNINSRLTFHSTDLHKQLQSDHFCVVKYILS